VKDIETSRAYEDDILVIYNNTYIMVDAMSNANKLCIIILCFIRKSKSGKILPITPPITTEVIDGTVQGFIITSDVETPNIK